MKKVINGKTYNTDTATKIANWSNGKMRNDATWTYEALYISPKGQYFIEGDRCPHGGLFWWEEEDTQSKSDEQIKLVTKEQALRWCEDRDIEADTIAEHFDVEEG